MLMHTDDIAQLREVLSAAVPLIAYTHLQTGNAHNENARSSSFTPARYLRG